MTPNIFKKVIYHLKIMVDCQSPKIFYSNQLSNQLEDNNNNYSGIIMAGTSNLARNHLVTITIPS